MTLLNVLKTQNNNLVINGACEINQRNENAIPITSGNTYVIDRWFLFPDTYFSTPPEASQSTDAPSGFYNSLFVENKEALAPPANKKFFIGYKVEGLDLRSIWGKSTTLSFWVKSTKTGIYGISVRSDNTEETMVNTYTIDSASTWEFKTVNFDFSTATIAKWNFDNTTGAAFTFCLDHDNSGTETTGTFNTWLTGGVAQPYLNNNQAKWTDNVNATFNITGVKLEANSIATPFIHRPFSYEIKLAKRYFETSEPRGKFANSTTVWSLHQILATDANAPGTEVYGQRIYYETEKRIVPTVRFYDSGESGGTIGQLGKCSIYSGAWNTAIDVSAFRHSEQSFSALIVIALTGNATYPAIFAWDSAAEL